jgi:hypothetical protein
MPMTIAAMKPNETSAASTFSRIESSIVCLPAGGAGYGFFAGLGRLLMRAGSSQLFERDCSLFYATLCRY